MIICVHYYARRVRLVAEYTSDAQRDLHAKIRTILWFGSSSPNAQAAQIIAELGLVQQDTVISYQVAGQHHAKVTRTIHGRSEVIKDTERGIGTNE